MAENYWHEWIQTLNPNGSIKCHTQRDYMDYSTAVVDPADDTTFWVIHAYASSSTTSLQLVVGKVVP